MQEILHNLSMLHTSDYFETAVAPADLEAAIDRLSKVVSSLPEDAAASYSSFGSGPINANTEIGSQYNNTLSGNNAQQMNHYGK